MVGTIDEFPFELPAEAKTALLKSQEVKISVGDQNVYRVIVPIIVDGKPAGAVEFALVLVTFLELAEQYWLTATLLVASIVVILTIFINIRSRLMIYRPLNIISTAINNFKEGDLEARADIKSKNEFGDLGKELNRMFAEIEQLTNEKEGQNEILTEKIKAATSELERRNLQLEKANAETWQATNLLSMSAKLAAAGQTAAQFAHEVGTPLNLISGHVQLLHKKIDSDESAKKRLDVIGSQIERIEEIVHRMLDKTRFGDVKNEPLNINKELENIFELIEPKLTGENIDFELELAKDMPNIESNSKRLQQIFLNLINNAADAMPNGGILEISTTNNSSDVVVKISDNGTGMDYDTQKHIFEPLFTTKERGQGTGLGLPVVKQILNEQNARIEVESKKGKGTTFSIYFQKSAG
jgi:signal transduction histidine kinase